MPVTLSIPLPFLAHIRTIIVSQRVVQLTMGYGKCRSKCPLAYD
jgi:hypothetical protein